MRNLMFICLLLLFSCAEKNTEVYPLYKINAVVKPSGNIFHAEMSMNYVSETLTDTVVFLLNKNILVDRFYGRHLSEWIPEKYPEDDRLYQLKVVFTPALKAYEFVRINSTWSAPLNALIDTGFNEKEFSLKHADYWYPVELNERDKFFALNFETENNTSVKENGRFIDGKWQVLTENPTDKIDITFIQN